MSRRRTITGKVGVWLNEYSHIGPQEIEQSSEKDIAEGVYYSNGNGLQGWTRIAEATVTFEVPDARELVATKIEALKAEKTKTLADAQFRANSLEKQIQTLLAICHDGTAA